MEKVKKVSKAKERGFKFYKLWKDADDKAKDKVLKRVKCISVEGRTYSPMNTYLLAMQTNEEGGVFGGFQQWRKQGRKVKKGSSGYSIMFPSKFKKKDDDEEGNLRFYFTTVFHENQTEEVKDEQ